VKGSTLQKTLVEKEAPPDRGKELLELKSSGASFPHPKPERGGSMGSEGMGGKRLRPYEFKNGKKKAYSPWT